MKDFFQNQPRSVLIQKKFSRFGFSGDEVLIGSTKTVIVVYNSSNKRAGEYSPISNTLEEFSTFVRNIA